MLRRDSRHPTRVWVTSNARGGVQSEAQCGAWVAACTYTRRRHSRCGPLAGRAHRAFPWLCRQQDDRLSARGLAATVVVVVRATAGGARSAALTQHRVGAGGDARWSGQRRAIRTRARAVGKFAAGDNKSTGKNVAMCTTRGLARRLRTVAMSQVHEDCARRHSGFSTLLFKTTLLIS